MQDKTAFNPIFWLKRAHLAVRKTMDEALSAHNLTSSQIEVMAIASHHEGVEHRTLMEMIGITSPTLTNIVDGLVERGYIERRISPEDARVKQLYVTSEGRELLQGLFHHMETFNQQMLANFSAGEMALLSELLQRLATNAHAMICDPMMHQSK